MICVMGVLTGILFFYSFAVNMATNNQTQIIDNGSVIENNIRKEDSEEQRIGTKLIEDGSETTIICSWKKLLKMYSW